MHQLESSWHRRIVDHVLTYSGTLIVVRSHKPSRITRQKTCCASESNTSVRVVFANRSGFDAPVGVVMAWEERESCLNLCRTTNRVWISETFMNYEAKDLLRKSVNHVLTCSRRQIAVGSQKPSRITRQKTCCASKSNTSVRAVFANRSGFKAPIAVVLALEERRSCLNIFRTTNSGRISETFKNYEEKDLLRQNLHELRGIRLVAQVNQTCRFALYLRTEVVLMLQLESSWHGRSVDHDLTYSERQIAFKSQKPSRITRQKTWRASKSNTSVRAVFANLSGFDVRIGVFTTSEERGSFLNIFRTKNHGRISKTFTNYEAKDLLRNESNTSVRVVFTNRSGFDAPIGVVLASEERGSCLNIFRNTNRGQISETFTNYEAKDLLRNGFDAAIGVFMAWEERASCLYIFRMKNRDRLSKTFMNYEAKHLSRNESNTWDRVVVANQSGFDVPVGVVMAWEERGSCLNIFRTKNHVVMAWEERGSLLNIFRMKNCSRISETMTTYEAKDLLRKNLHELRGKTLVAQLSETRRLALYLLAEVDLIFQLESSWHGRSVDHVLTYSGRQIAVGSWKHSRITRQKTCCASESNTSVRVVLSNRSGFDAPIGVVLAWEERGSCLNISRMTSRGRISETFTNYEAKDLLPDESITSNRVVFANRSGFDAPIGVVLAWEERGSCLNIFRMTNRDRILETFTNYEAKRLVAKVSQTRRFTLYFRTRVVLMLQLELSWHGRSVDHVLTYFDQQIAVGSQKPSRITRQKTCCAMSQARRFPLYLRTGVVSMLQLDGRSVDHVLTYSRRQIAVGSQKPSRVMCQKTCCASDSNTSVRVVFANQSGFDAPIGVVLAWEERGSCLNIFRMTNCGWISETFTKYEAKDSLHSGFDAAIGVFLAWEERGSCLNIFRTTNRCRISETFTNYEAKDLLRNRLGIGGASIMSYHIQDDKSQSDFKNLHELRGKRLVAQVSQTCRFALYLRTVVVLMLQLQSSWHGSESNTSISIVFANRSGFDAPIGVVFAWKECGSCFTIFRMTNRGRISEIFTNYKAKDLLCNESNTSVRVVFANWSGFDAPIVVFLAWEKRASCLNIFWMTNRARISETFKNYELKDLMRNESNTSVRVVFANRSGFDAPIVVFLAWEKRGSCLNIFQMTNRGRISKTFTNYKAKDLLCNESNTSVRVVFANRSGFDAPIVVFLAWENRGSCLNIFWMTNRARISETFKNYELQDLMRKVVLMLQLESSWHGRSVDHVLTYFGQQIVVGSQKPSRITRQKTCSAIVMAWEERGSCLNIFRMTNRGRIPETFTNYEAKDLLRKNLHKLRGKRLVAQMSETCRFALYMRTGVDLMFQLESSWHGRRVDHVLTYSRQQIAVGSLKLSQITWQKTCCANNKSRSDLKNLLELRCKRLVAQFSWHGRSVDHVLTYFRRQIAVGSQKPSRITLQKTCCASESNTWVRVVVANQSGFDVPVGVFMAWEERGSCLNIFRTKNHGQILETFTIYEAKDLLCKRSVDHAITYSGRKIAVGSQKPCRLTRQKTCCANEKSRSNLRNIHELRGKRLVAQLSETRRLALCLRPGVDLIFQLESSWHGRSVDHVLTYFGRQIAVGSQKPSRITRQKTCCASESNTSVRIVLVNRSGFDGPIAVDMAWVEHGSCISIFRMKNCGQISETFTNYEAKDLLRNESNTSVPVVFANRSGFDAPIGVVLAWKERGSCLNIFRTTNRVWITETFTNYEAKDLLRNESNTSVRVVFANHSGFGAPIAVIKAWEEIGSCLNIFRTTNRGRISETFTNYETKDLLRKSVDHDLTYYGRQIGVRSRKPSRITRQKTCCANDKSRSDLINLHELRGKTLIAQVSQKRRFANRSGFDAAIGVVMAWDERGSCLNIFQTTNRSRISETFMNYEAKDLLRKRSVDHVLTFSGRQIAVRYQKPLQITRRKTCCACELNTSVRVVFANRSGFDAPIAVVLAWEERGSCLNIFQTKNRGQISETFTYYEAKDLLRNNLHELRGKRLVAQVCQKRRFALYLPTVVVLMLQLESSWHGRRVDHVLIYSGRKIVVGYQKPSQIMRQKTCYASESNTSVRVVFANRSGFDVPIGVVLAWEERGSCLNIFRTTNCYWISETFMNCEAKGLLRK
ncbi:uncharacterized protein G2W53_041707 [Senna tora]|uniref:Uncharacterized protein n=1 Tax=Senna tora TaxID=362788 RepID=A0A834W1P4_9FABA|nr:uncharacterized protein G2W53_041707 [Senna tora]